MALTLWALAMIIPDFYRLYQPLGSFGFYANNDGIITDVQGPFHKQTDSPAFQAGLRAGDRLDLEQMRCIPISTLRCASAIGLGRFSPRHQSTARRTRDDCHAADRREESTSLQNNGHMTRGCAGFCYSISLQRYSLFWPPHG